jgi:hypothetical protein
MKARDAVITASAPQLVQTRRGVGERLARFLVPRRVRDRAWSFVVRRNHPWLTQAYLALHPEVRSLRLTRRTALVIDGHSRCANTYAACAFEQANPGTRLTHHLHNPWVFRRAARIGVPALLLIRRPADVVASMVQFEPGTTVEDVLESFLDFYRRVLPVVDDLVVAEFDDVVADFGRVIPRVNDRFGTSFAPYDRTADSERDVFAAVEAFGLVHYAADDFENRVSRPSAGRRLSRTTPRAWSPEQRALLAEAERLHREVLARADLLRVAS